MSTKRTYGIQKYCREEESNPHCILPVAQQIPNHGATIAPHTSVNVLH